MFEPPRYEQHFYKPNYEVAPIFVVGLGRSGTTLLRLMLHSHPAIAMLGETWFGPRVWERRWAFPIYDDIEPFRSRLVDVFISLLRKHNDFPIDLDIYRDRVLSGPGSLSQLLTELGEIWKQKCGAERWGEKTPVHLEYIDVLARMYPRLRVLHIIRDPRDVAASLCEAEFAECDDAVAFALEWLDAVDTEEGLKRAEVNLIGKVLRVHYEDLINAPVNTLKGVCSHIGEEFDSGMLEFQERSHLAPDKPWMEGLERPLNSGSIGRWKEDLDRREARVIEAVCWKRMVEFGYESGNPDVSKQTIADMARLLTGLRERERERGRRWRDHVQMHRGDYRELLRTLGQEGTA